MGNEVSRTAAAQQSHGGRKVRINIDSPSAEDFQKASLEDVSECLLRRDRDFGRFKMAINSEEFRQVFEGILTNPTELFSVFDNRGKGLVDVSEVFASAFLFAAGTPKGLDAKLEKIFALFDFDGKGALSDVEAEIMLECVVRGGATAGELTLRDLKDWISEREDVAVFLSNFIEARMIISSQELVDRSVALGMSMCKYPSPQDDSSGEHTDGTVDGARAGEMLRYLTTLGKTECLRAGLEAVVEADAAAVVRMLSGNSGATEGRRERVDVEALEELLRFWVAFSVVDEDGVGSVSMGDLKALLWLGGGTGGEEPPEATVQKTANDIDESQDGVINRIEWMRFTAVLDEGTGNVGYDSGLLKVFRRYDDDHSGSITATEMTMMVRDSVSEAIAEAPENCSLRPDMERVVETLVKDVARDLVAVVDVTGSGMLGWTEFKKNQTLVTARLATLREFVFSVALQRGSTAAATADTPPELTSSNGSTRPDSL